MRSLILLSLATCAHTLPQETKPSAQPQTESVSEAPKGHTAATNYVPPRPRPPVVVPARSADELTARAGLTTFVQDEGLEVAAIDWDAMERWFTHPPRTLFLYIERPVNVAEPGITVRGQCRRVKRLDSPVLNGLTVSIWEDSTSRTTLDLGQNSVVAANHALREGDFDTISGRFLPMAAIVWDDEHIRYAEGAQQYEVACVHAVRSVPCGEGHPPGSRAYCVDDELEVRPRGYPFVPHVGPATPAYPNPVPDVPEAGCTVQCERSACYEALRSNPIPPDYLYEESAPVLAVFRDRAACRAFVKARAKIRVRDADQDGVTW